MPTSRKRNFPVGEIRQLLEPGPIVLVSSAWRGRTNIMTLGWHTVLEFQPSLVACLIANGNHTFEMVRRSRECVINVPTIELADTVVRVGNTSGRDIDKFAAFGLTAQPAAKVGAPLVRECYANLECRLYDAALIRKYNLFVFEVVHARVASSPRVPKTMHYRGDGEFMIAGATTRKYRRLFTPDRL